MEVESLSDKNIKANTQVAPFFINLKKVDDQMRFSMILDVYKTGSGLKDIVLINPLAGENDRFAIRDGARNSKGDIQLVNDGNFVVEKVNATSGVLIELIDSSRYSIQYTTKSHDYIFVDDDWGTSNFDIWMDANEIVANGLDFADVTATRTIIDNSVPLNMNEAIKVSYIASLNNYYDSTWEANSSFAYGAIVDGVNSIHAETRTLAVKANIFSDRMKVMTDVLDPAKTPLRTDFDLKLVEYDRATNEELAVAPFTVKLTNTNNGYLEDITWLENLNRDSYYTITAVEYEGYRSPKVELSFEKDPTGLTTWEALVSYERIIYDEIEVIVDVISNQKKTLKNVNYKINVLNESDSLMNTIDRNVDVANNSSVDFVSGLETGNKYQIMIEDYSDFDSKLELISEKNLILQVINLSIR